MLNKTFMNKNYLPLWFASKTVHLCLMVLGVATGGGIERVQVNKPSVTRSIWSGSFPLPDVRQKPSNRPITVLHTPRKINMEPKDSPNWKGTSSSKPSFSGCMFNLPGCISEANNTQFSPPLFFFSMRVAHSRCMLWKLTTRSAKDFKSPDRVLRPSLKRWHTWAANLTMESHK